MSGDSIQKPEPTSFPRARLRPPASVRLLEWVLAVMTVMLLGGAALVPPPLRDILLMCMAMMLPAALVWGWLRWRVPRGAVGLGANHEGVWVDGKLVLRRAQVDRAMVVVEKGTVVVTLQNRHFACLVDVESEAEGQALVRALGLDPTQSISEFVFDSRAMQSVPPWAYWLYLTLPLLFLPLALVVGWWAVPALMAVWYAGLLAAALPQKLAVGLDGVMLRWPGRKRMITYAEIAGIESSDREIRLRLRNGDTEQVSAYWTGQAWERGWWKSTIGFGSRQAYVDTVVARLREAQEASRGGEGSAAAWLVRQGKPAGEWLRGLRGLLAPGQADFRHDAPEPEQLWATLEDTRQAPATRVAAAAALAPTLGDEGRERLRVAASVVVNPRLRVALEATSRGDDEALLEAIEQLDESAASRARG